MMGYIVELRKSNKKFEWDDQFDSILEQAEQNGLQFEFECRQGFCGECMAQLISGEVAMDETEGLDDKEPDGNYILLCVSVPRSDVVIDI